MYALIVQIGTTASDGMEELIGARDIHHPHQHLLPMFQPHTDGTLVDAAAVVGGAVNGVDNPSVFVLAIVDILFLAEKARIRHYCRESFAEEVLHSQIRGGHDIFISPLLLYLKSVGDHPSGCITNDTNQLFNRYHAVYNIWFQRRDAIAENSTLPSI